MKILAFSAKLALFVGNVLTNRISTQMLHRELMHQEQENAFDGFS